MTSILVVEDDAAIRQAVTRGLTERGHVVTTASDGIKGIDLAITAKPDVVLLDLGLPDVDGLSVIKMVRGVSQVPIIVVTAQDDDQTTVAALDAGADDYVVKPFGIDQLEARIRAVLRRGTTADDDGPIVVGDLVVDPRSREVTLEGRSIVLTRKEFDLLHALASRAGQVVTKRTLLAEVWQQPYGGADRTVDVHMSWLRRKLGESASEPRYLHTIRGVGARLTAPSTEGD
jgi:DNA-binding response OmpR family regulator